MNTRITKQILAADLICFAEFFVIREFVQSSEDLNGAHDEPVQALAADAGDPAFAPSIGIGRLHRSPDDLQACGSKDGIEGGRKVAVADRGSGSGA